MFAATLWGNEHFGAFEHFKQTLLNTFAAYIAGNGRVIAFAGNLIQFINVYNTFFGSGNIVIAYL